MAFANGFNGDVIQLDYILQTLERKGYGIKGITVNDELSVAVAGESATYYKQGASTVSTGALGAKHTYTSTGVERKTIAIDKSINIDAVLPHANVATVSADVVGKKVILETTKRANLHNSMLVKFIEDEEAVDAALTTPLGLHKDIVTDYGYQRGTSDVKDIAKVLFNAKKDFNVKNKESAVKPTAIFMGPALVADMKAANLLSFKEWTREEEVEPESLIGYFDGMAVIECSDLSSDFEAVFVHADAFGAPINVNTLIVSDGTQAGYPGGTIIAGEMGYAFEACDDSLVLWLKA